MKSHDYFSLFARLPSLIIVYKLKNYHPIGSGGGGGGGGECRITSNRNNEMYSDHSKFQTQLNIFTLQLQRLSVY